jgi:hypothetical protein
MATSRFCLKGNTFVQSCLSGSGGRAVRLPQVATCGYEDIAFQATERLRLT